VFARSTIFTGFNILNTGVVGSNPTRGRYVFLYLFCFVLYINAVADLPSKECKWFSVRLIFFSGINSEWEEGTGP
jgi:hypothetical protein